MLTEIGMKLFQKRRKFGKHWYMPVFMATNEEDAVIFTNQLRAGGSDARKHELTAIERESLAFPPERKSSIKFIIYGR